jgi:GTP-binding protein
MGKLDEARYVVMDTGGLADELEGVAGLVTRQAWQAAEEANAILFLVDGRAGLTSSDEELAVRLRRLGKPLYLVVNKTEHLQLNTAKADFYRLGIGEPFAISASHRRGVAQLMQQVLAAFPVQDEFDDVDATDDSIRLAIVGRPNVGKSTLVNRLLGEERVVAHDMPGTTRDSITIPFEKDGQAYTLIDTAGVRRRSRVNEGIEKFSIIKTLQAIEKAHVVVLMVDAREGVVEQDATLLGLVLDSGRGLVVAVNKWDHLDADTRQSVCRNINRKLAFLDFANFHFISALHGSGVMDILDSVTHAFEAAYCKLSTPELTRILESAVHKHQPPLVRGRQRIKLRYAHQGGQNPPLIVIHGNRTEHIPATYQRYLAHTFREALNLWGTPVHIVFKSGENPYISPKPSRGATKSVGTRQVKAKKRK